MHSGLLLNAIEEAQLLGIFKSVCNDYDEPLLKNKLRNILANSSNEKLAIKNIVNNNYNKVLSDMEVDRMCDLVKAYLKKSQFRKNISNNTKKELLSSQNYKCSFCGKSIDMSAHADHIVPFKYVGDELSNNLQMLCSTCNERKNDSLDYQIRFLLKLV